MGKLRNLFSILLLTTLLTACAWAQSNLTQIRDTIYNSDGTPFNGTVVITWVGFSTPSSGTVSPLSTSARIYNGALSVLLVPSTTAAAGSYYQVVYYSSNGTTSWTETWAVPPSTNALSVSGVRTSTTSGSAGTSSGSGSGSTSGGTSGTQYATLPIAISQVTGLSTSLNTLSNSVSSLTGTVNSLSGTVTTNGNTLGTLGTTVNGLSSTLTTNTSTLNSLQTTVNSLSSTVGSNSSTLASLNSTVNALSGTVATNGNTLGTLNTTVNALSGTVTTNGNALASLNSTLNALSGTVTTNGNTLATLNSTVNALSGTVTANGSTLTSLNSTVNALNGTVATNGNTLSTLGTRVSGLSSSLTSLTQAVTQLQSGGGNGSVNTAFIDGEMPAGSVNSSNTIYTLSAIPVPASSLELYRNGLVQTVGVDYTVSGTTVTFLPVAVPKSGDLIQAYYRVAGSSPAPLFADGEVPAGAVSGSNTTFTLAFAPSPAAGLRLFKNGVLLAQPGDYTVNGQTITFVATVIPQSGDSLNAYYRH